MSVPVPLSWRFATPMKPLKSLMVDGSRPGCVPVGSVGAGEPSTRPGKKKTPGIGVGIPEPGLPASAFPGNPDRRNAPAAPAVLSICRLEIPGGGKLARRACKRDCGELERECYFDVKRMRLPLFSTSELKTFSREFVIGFIFCPRGLHLVIKMIVES